jgi:hypothetical protein
MTREEFIKVLDEKGCSYNEEGDKIVVPDIFLNADLGNLISLPPGVVFENKWGVNLNSLTSIPPDIEFKNGGSVNLESLKSLSPGVLFDNGRHIYLDSLKSLSSGVIFNNGGHVFLESITSISPGVEFNNEGDVLMNYFFSHFFGDWEGKVSGISSKRLLNKMIKDRLFDRK